MALSLSDSVSDGIAREGRDSASERAHAHYQQVNARISVSISRHKSSDPVHDERLLSSGLAPFRHLTHLPLEAFSARPSSVAGHTDHSRAAAAATLEDSLASFCPSLGVATPLPLEDQASWSMVSRYFSV